MTEEKKKGFFGLLSNFSDIVKIIVIFIIIYKFIIALSLSLVINYLLLYFISSDYILAFSFALVFSVLLTSQD